MTNAHEMGATPAMRALVELGRRLEKVDADTIDLLQTEQEIRAALDAVGVELMVKVLQAADIDALEILVNGAVHGRIDQRHVDIHTSFGPAPVCQTKFGRGRGHPTVIPMEKRLGLVEGLYTPKCAKVLSHFAAVTVRSEAMGLLRELGGIGVGEATAHRLPLAVMARYERDREVIEPHVRGRSQIPAEATTVQVGLDGVMVPMEGEECRPRGREHKNGDPDPPRHERRYGVVGNAGPAADDATMGVAWHEASVGTLAFFNADGEHLSTVYIGRMPEAHKATLGEMLKEEVLHAFTERPDLQPVMASDGAQGQWETLADITASLPEPARDRAVWLLDFFHAAEHLQDACDAIDGGGSAEAKVRRQALAETLKVYDDGADRVIRRLAHQRRQATREKTRDRIDAEIGYFQNNRHRMRYKQALDAKLPIATGPTEAAAKTLVGTRMKRSGARFEQHGGQAVLTLRAALKSARFDDLFDVLVDGYKADIRLVA